MIVHAAINKRVVWLNRLASDDVFIQAFSHCNTLIDLVSHRHLTAWFLYWRRLQMLLYPFDWIFNFRFLFGLRLNLLFLHFLGVTWAGKILYRTHLWVCWIEWRDAKLGGSDGVVAAARGIVVYQVQVLPLRGWNLLTLLVCYRFPDLLILQILWVIKVGWATL